MNATKLQEIIDEACTSELVELNNAICETTGCSDDLIFWFDDPEDFYEEMFSTKWDAVRATLFGDVHMCDDYIRFNGYANLETLSDYSAEEFAKMTISDNMNLFDNAEDDDIEDMSDLIEWIR